MDAQPGPDFTSSDTSSSKTLSPTSNSATGADVSDPIPSRLNVSEEQREIKRRYEEKQREEACRSAQAERIAKKQVGTIQQ